MILVELDLFEAGTKSIVKINEKSLVKEAIEDIAGDVNENPDSGELISVSEKKVLNHNLSFEEQNIGGGDTLICFFDNNREEVENVSDS
ncbi:MAG: hypothetical protein Q4E51_03140 [Lachnospiraceae bacterium]|nr:hypothetical protein [Lachnospiraceae bacterium]